MKTLFLLAGTAVILAAGPLADVKTVYVFPMRRALDQHLANRLAEEHVFQVVFDPKAADAVLTDHLDPAFDASFDKLVLSTKTPTGDQRPTSNFGQSAGTLFLVNKQKQVIWSTYVPAKDNSKKQTEITAKHAVDRLKKALQPAPPPAS